MWNALGLLAQADDGGVIGLVILAVALVIAIGVVAGVWKTFEKAGQPGWACIVPIYNVVVMLEIAGKPLWWILLLFIPFVNIIVTLLIFIDFAKAFGKGAGFGIGLWLLGFIFFPILGFGDAEYVGPQE